MNALSLFQEEILAKLLLEVINNEKPKSDLEKTEWWNVILCESLADRDMLNFIKYDWPKVKPIKILHTLLAWHILTPETPEDFTIHPILKDLLIDSKLIKIILKERSKLSSSSLESDKMNVLLSESKRWMEIINKGRIEVSCDTIRSVSWNSYDEDNEQMAGLVISNFPKTLDYCKKQNIEVFICGIIEQRIGNNDYVHSNIDQMIRNYRKHGTCGYPAQ